MSENELRWDKLLRIRTSGRDDSHADEYNFPYEPTPYCVLERLASKGYIGKKNMLVDYGCGKGRVAFFLSYQTRCRSIGIECDKELFDRAISNKESCASGNRTKFMSTKAEAFKLPDEADRFYFFNPFSVTILKSVLHKIIKLSYVNLKQMLLFFYYPSDEYIAELSSIDELKPVDEIDCHDLFHNTGNDRERVLVYEL